MTFADLPAQATVFLDTNVFVYHFSNHPLLFQPCRDLLKRVEDGNLGGIITTHQISDLAHRLMTIEACDVHGWPMKGIAGRLKSHPTAVQSLGRFRQAIDEVPKMGVQVVSTTAALISAAAAISQQAGLLSNDALIVAVMQHLGLVHLASHDADFDNVAGITRYAPV
jgi:predicted nucleic acid-binding protein